MSTATQTKSPAKTGQQTANTAPTGGALAKPDTTALYAAVDKIDEVAEKYRQEIDQPLMRDFRRAVVTALAIRGIRDAMTPPVMDLLKSLMNSPLGFLTDRTPDAYREDYRTPYDDETIKTAAIEAVIQGVLWTNNHWNIIGKRCYITKEGYYYKLSNLAGLSDLNVVPSVPVIREGSTVVRVAGTWKMEGSQAMLTDQEGKPGRNFAIVVNKSMGADAIIGKAYRKAYKAIWDKIHGCESSAPDDDEVQQQVIDRRTGTEALKDRLQANAPQQENGTPQQKEATAPTTTLAEGEIDPNDNGIDYPPGGLPFRGAGGRDNDPSR